MPPRYAYWTILIDNGPTAFRARDKEELLPTLYQLRRKNANVVMKWFARGRLWDTPEQAQWAGKSLERERRSRDWRPGGEHKDPRARFDKPKKDRLRARDKSAGAGPHGARDKSAAAGPHGDRRDRRPFAERRGGKPPDVAQVFRPPHALPKPR